MKRKTPVKKNRIKDIIKKIVTQTSVIEEYCNGRFQGLHTCIGVNDKSGAKDDLFRRTDRFLTLSFHFREDPTTKIDPKEEYTRLGANSIQTTDINGNKIELRFFDLVAAKIL